MTINWRKAAYQVIRPFVRVLLWSLPREDPWERIPYKTPITRYGAGSHHDFGWYLEGDSLVGSQSLEDVQDWLLACQYVHDIDLFHEQDFWQHPCTFERLRSGDCEDHALWAWRKLLELGYDAEFVSGRCLPWQPNVNDGERGHAWVLLRLPTGVFVLESVAKDRERMLRPLAEAREEYRPEFGVARDLKRYAFNGYVETFREREFGLPKGDSARRSA